MQSNLRESRDGWYVGKRHNYTVFVGTRINIWRHSQYARVCAEYSTKAYFPSVAVFPTYDTWRSDIPVVGTLLVHQLQNCDRVVTGAKVVARCHRAWIFQHAKAPPVNMDVRLNITLRLNTQPIEPRLAPLCLPRSPLSKGTEILFHNIFFRSQWINSMITGDWTGC